MAILLGKAVVEEKPAKLSALLERGYGEKRPEGLVLDLFEAVHLLRAKKISISASGKGAKRVAERKLLALGAKSEKNFLEKLRVYQDLRARGRIAKTGFKFGFDFRVYPQGKKPGEGHSEFVVAVAGQGKSFSASEIARMTRMAAGLKAKLILAVVDSEHEVSYYEASRANF